MQKPKLEDNATAGLEFQDSSTEAALDGTIVRAAFLNDNFENLFNIVENAGYTLIDDDTAQIVKALKGPYNSAYTYNTDSIATQTVSDVVLGSDGKYYEVQEDGVSDDDPVSSITGRWKQIPFDKGYSDSKLFNIASGTANAITLEIPSVLTYSKNSIFMFKATLTNTGATTINLNGLGLKNIVVDNVALNGGEIETGKEYFLRYSLNDNFELINISSDTNYVEDTFIKPVKSSPLFSKESPSSLSIPSGFIVGVEETVIVLESDYTLDLDTDLDTGTKTAGTDYYVYAKDDSTFYISADESIVTDKKIGGFHYGLTLEAETATGNNTESDMVKIRGINEYSFWDLRYFPKCGSAKGMFCNGIKYFDIYLGDEDYGLDFYSKPYVKIAGGDTTNDRGIPKIPLIYGGDGTTTYGKLTPFQAYDIANAAKKQLITYKDFTDIAYGVVEGESAGTEPVSGETGHDANLTSKYGMEQATGTQYIWSAEIGQSTSGSWNAIADGRGQVYTNAYVAILGGSRAGAAGQSGSRYSDWAVSLSNSSWTSGFRLCSDLVIL